LFERAKSVDPTELRSAALYADDVVREFYPTNGSEPGFSTPWAKLHGRLAFRPGEVSILAGANGSGKSELAGHVLLAAIAQDERACVASLEFKAVKWLKRLTRQAAASREPTPEHIHAVHRWYGGRLWAFDVTGTAKTIRILEVFAYAARRYGIRVFVIDNLAKCGLGEDDYNGQKHFVDALTDFAKTHDAHVLLVHHTRKGESEDKPQTKWDIKGSGGITDMADTVLVLWRNKPKEEALRQAEGRRQTPDRETLEKIDAALQCHKQRNGEEEPAAGLWFDRASHQFIERQGDAPRIYVAQPNAHTAFNRMAAAASDAEVTL
jgi:twinkle protein